MAKCSLWSHIFEIILVALFWAKFLWTYCLEGFAVGGHTLFGRTFLSKFSLNILFGRFCCWGSHFFGRTFLSKISMNILVGRFCCRGSHFFSRTFLSKTYGPVYRSNLYNYVLCNRNFAQKSATRKVWPPFLGKRGMVRLTDLTFTTMYYVIEILLKKVRHEKCDPCCGVILICDHTNI